MEVTLRANPHESRESIEVRDSLVNGRGDYPVGPGATLAQWAQSARADWWGSTNGRSTAHCLFGTEGEGIPLWVTFDEIIDANVDGLIDAGVTLHTGTAVVHPLFPGAPNDPHDVAVFVLDEPVDGGVTDRA